jgi:ribonucleotide reductase beta subunit family protein with ferritin-like domain
MSLLNSKEFSKSDDNIVLSPDLDKYMPGSPDEFTKIFNKMSSFIWAADECTFNIDPSHIKSKLTDAENFVIKQIIIFFLFSDAFVNENIANNFRTEVTGFNIKMNYDLISFIEGVHRLTYEKIVLEY